MGWLAGQASAHSRPKLLAEGRYAFVERREGDQL